MSSSNSRRKKSRRSSSSELEGSEKKSLARNGIDFVAILSGFVVALVAILLIWNSIGNDRSSNVEAKVDRTDIDKLVVEATDEEFAQMLDSEDLDFITRVFDAINRNGESGIARNDIKTHYRRVAASDRILSLDPAVDAELKYQAAANKLNALSKAFTLNERFELNEPVEISLRKAAASMLSSGEKRIALQARLAILAIDARNPEEDFAGVGRKLYQLAKDEPDEPSVHEILLSSINYHVSTDRRRAIGLQLIEAVLGNIREGEFVEHRELSEVFQRYTDLKLLADSDYFNAWEARTFSGPAGYAQLRDVAINLTTRKNGGKKLVDTVSEISRWFEQAGEFEYSKPIFQSLFDHANDFELPSICKRAQQVGQHGLKRAALIGQPMSFQGNTLNGQLAQEDFSDQVVIVVFFKLDDPESMSAIKSIEGQRQTWKERPVREIAVCMDTNLQSDRAKKIESISKSYKNWTICIPDETGQIPIFDQCPSDQVPRVMLVNKKGLVTQVDLTPASITTQVGFALISDRLN